MALHQNTKKPHIFPTHVGLCERKGPGKVVTLLFLLLCPICIVVMAIDCLLDNLGRLRAWTASRRRQTTPNTAGPGPDAM